MPELNLPTPAPPTSGHDFLESEPNLDAPSIPPSSRSHESWAASCPESYPKTEVNGEAIYVRTKKCIFCKKAVRLGPRGDGALVQHMKSNRCKAMQHNIETTIHGTAETAIDETEANGASTVPTTSFHTSSTLNTEPLAPTYCEGAELHLTTSLWANYPWHLHDPTHSASIPFIICQVNWDGDVVRVRSRSCAMVVPWPGRRSCNACDAVLETRLLKQLIERTTIETPANGLNRRFYSHKQVCDRLETTEEMVQKYRLQELQAHQTVQRLLGKLNDHKRFMLAVAASDDEGLGRLVSIALRQGASAGAIVERLGKAQQGLYHCQSYSEKTVDMALLSLRLGGPRMLAALSKFSHFPSLSTVYRKAERFYLRPSVGFPTLAEVLSNIKSMCGQTPRSRMRGFTLMIDEIALEERLRYSFAEDAIVGICREHTSKCDTTKMSGRPISHLMELRKLLDSGECHRAKEATLVALAPFGESDYTPIVVLISGTCKTELVEDQKNLIELVLKAWAQAAIFLALLGIIWSIATDGDGRRRQALFHICMSHELPRSSPIYNELSRLALLNLFCGEGDITHDGDFKHEEKRLASALRSESGIFVNGTHITPSVIKQHLRRLRGLPSSRIDSLFDNSDRQNVPKAHALLKSIHDACQLPEVQLQIENQAFVLLGERLYSFYAPHTVPSMSLSQQVAYMAKCAFILFSLYRIDRTGFITSQLYYDIQASIKNALFCIAKTKVLDPTLPFYLLQLGDDRLEGLFGVYRTATHNCNPDLLGMAERSSAAREVNNILTKHPNFDRKPYRLSIDGASGIDHLNPASWEGDVCVGNVVLQTSWDEGLAQARQVLQHAGIIPNFDAISLRALAHGLPVDLMRPFGNYVGVTNPCLKDSEIELDPSPVTQDENTGLAPTNSQLHSVPIAPPDPTSTSDFNPAPAALSPEELGALMDVIERELPIEERLEPCMPAGSDDLVEIPSGPVTRGWVTISDSRSVRIESATRLLLGTESMEKSSDRLRRVRGFSCYPSIDSQSDSILGDVCLIGQLVLGLVRANSEIALAAVKVTSISIGTGINRSQIELVSLDHLNSSDVVLKGQVLALEFCDASGTWYWNMQYITSTTGASKSNIKPLLVDFNACMTEPVNPPLADHLGNLVWSFKHNELLAATDLLWAKCAKNYHSIPLVSSTNNFPYQNATSAGIHKLIHLDASRAIEVMPAERCGLCHLCGHSIPIKQHMRTHVAKHIRAKQRDIRDPLLRQPIENAPCGFCGRSGRCKTSLRVTKKSATITSDCDYFDKFSLKPAEKSTSSSPCTNRPILCQFPPCLKKDPIWSYNMRDHILEYHGHDEYTRAVHAGQFTITSEEDQRLRLDNFLIVPGKAPLVLPAAPFGFEKQIESVSAAKGSIPSPTMAQGPAMLSNTTPGASGSGSKRARFE